MNPSEKSRRSAPRRRSPFFASRPKKSTQLGTPLWRSQLPQILRIALFLVIGYLAYLWRREKIKPASAILESRVEVIRQARTQAPQGKLKINPAGFSKDAVIINESAKVIIPQPPTPPSAEKPLAKVDGPELWENMDIFGQDEIETRSKISATVDRLIGEFHQSPDPSQKEGEPNNNTQPFIIRRRAPTLKLPVPLLGRFEGRFGEKLLWHGPFWHRPGLEGWLAVTNQRLIWTTERKKPVLSKDLIQSELDRGQVALSSVVSAEVAYVRLPQFLFASALFVLWFPYGTALSLALLILYGAVKRPMLRVLTRDEPLYFPLKEKGLKDAVRCVEKCLDASEDRGKPAKQPDNIPKAWRKAN